MALRAATDADYEAVFGTPAPAAWFGVAFVKPYLVEGIGLVYRDLEGRWWGRFRRSSGGVKVRLILTAGRRLFDEAKARGIVVHAIPDPDIEGAAKLMQRLGFIPSEFEIGGLTVWTR